MFYVGVPTKAWELLTEHPSPEDIQKAANLIVAEELDLVSKQFAEYEMPTSKDELVKSFHESAKALRYSVGE